MGKRACILLENEKPKGGGMEKLASFIVDKRNLFFLLYIFALIFSAIATGWVKVEDDITTYLPDTTETRQGLTVMNDNFVTYGTANVMVSNITYDTALDIQSRLEDIEGVTTVEFDDTDEHYTNASALFSVSFDAEVGDERAENALQEIRDELEGSYDTSIYSEVGYDSSADLQSEMLVIVIIAAIIIVVVLTLTSRSYAEVPVLLMTFGAAALLNMGTNFLCGTISFISNSVTVILQLALAIDYAIILCHRFSDEHETLPTREACIAALSKAIPEISSSSLTTISGLAALAAAADGVSVIRGTSRLEYKECNRSEAIREEYAKLGIEVDTSEEDLMKIRGGKVRAARTQSHGDHRMAMSLAVAALRSDEAVEIEGAESVAKSYPGFFEDLEHIRV